MKDKKTDVLSTLSSFNTLLNDFPSLLTIETNGDAATTNTTVSFLLDISNLFGMSEKKMLDWVSSLLSDDDTNPTRKGILNVIEETIKAALLLHFNSMYNCETAPLIPDEFLKYSYTSRQTIGTDGRGIVIRLSSIDMFKQLKQYPFGEYGSLFYFDTDSESVGTPNVLYRSTDFNAWLWWIINYAKENNFKYYPWDNRVIYNSSFNGEDGNDNRIDFVETHINDSQFYQIGNIGHKKHIISAVYEEQGTTLKNSNVIRVFGCAETYRRAGYLGYNKTVFDFNADYIYSLKLFNSKTIVTSIINAITGLGGAMFGQLSLELNILIKKIEKTVEYVISNPTKKEDSGYFTFSEADYNDIVNDATLRYNGEYNTKNETNENVKLELNNVVEAIKKIDNATTTSDKEDAISYVVNTLSDTTKEYCVGINTPFTQQKDIIMNFIKEIITQVSLQVLSPKVMLLFAINNYFLNNDETNVKIDVDGFMKDFWNIISSCILKIADIILRSLFEMVLGYIRPVLVLIAEKLLLETLMYYKELLTLMLENCLPLFTFKNNTTNLVIDNVNYADIIPTKTQP